MQTHANLRSRSRSRELQARNALRACYFVYLNDIGNQRCVRYIVNSEAQIIFYQSSRDREREAILSAKPAVARRDIHYQRMPFSLTARACAEIHENAARAIQRTRGGASNRSPRTPARHVDRLDSSSVSIRNVITDRDFCIYVGLTG
jgi:hypothetical protein